MDQVEERIVEVHGVKISVFSDGSVQIHSRAKTKRRFGNLSPKGYLRIIVFENGKGRTVFVHKLVAMAFIPNPDNKPQINHKDGDKTNNRPENLEWCTNTENARHRYDVLGAYSSKCPVVCIETGEVFETISEAARKKKVMRSSIQRSLKGKKMQYSASGLHWERLGGDLISNTLET